MNGVDNRLQRMTEIEANVRQFHTDILSKTGGPPTDGGMEGRVARLESDMAHVKDTLKSLDSRLESVRSDIGSIKTDLTTAKVKIDHLPSKGFIFAVAMGMLAAAGGIMAAVVRFIPAAASSPSGVIAP